jgi:hypothetical protein
MCGFRSACPSIPSTPEQDEGSAVHFTPAEYRARTGKVTLRWGVTRPGARRRKPQGKGGWSWDMAGKSAKKQGFPMGERAHRHIIHLQGLSCSRKS